jgi:hypothetical protein
MDSQKPTLIICEIPKIYTPKPKKMNQNFSKNYFNFDILLLDNDNLENELDIKKNKSTLDSYSFEEIEKDFCLIKEKRDERKKKKNQKNLLLSSTRPNSVESENEIQEIKRPENPFYKNFE